MPNPLFNFPAPPCHYGYDWPFPASATIEVFHKQFPHMDYEWRIQYISHCARINFRLINR